MAAGTSLVIGATSGIGLAVAEALARRGDTVVVTSRDATRAAETAGAIGGETTGIAVDLTKPTSSRRAAGRASMTSGVS